MNKKLTDEAVQMCISVFENLTMEEIVNLSNDLGNVWKVGKKIKENIDFEDELDYDNFICVDGKCAQLKISGSDFDCAECILNWCSADECMVVCSGAYKVVEFKQ